jgi:hypothetical protein
VRPKPIQGWTLTTLREKLIKIGAKVVAHAKYVTFQLADVAVPRQLFAQISERMALVPRLSLGVRSSAPTTGSERRRRASAVYPEGGFRELRE